MTLTSSIAVVSGTDLQIDCTGEDFRRVESALIEVGDTIKSVSTGEEKNIEFLGNPRTSALPEKSKLDEVHSIRFKFRRVYLYG
ncbi:MAG: hypothetical protein CBB68_04080 [Rhodospirillaceae bacterium TMED8]|nr:hypothetical protein [Magnetovibrio sp.]OUT52050.1 MAG: hypothetical protein CBB68_04080 [Rhodospirillaceae bacterium TMED8]|tara:strand:- start:354 stop:605 length:252 start_codon:yes stop_codon:yes gene_type:complete